MFCLVKDNVALLQQNANLRATKSFRMEMLIRAPCKPIFLISMWMTSNLLERNKISIRLGETTSFLDVHLGCAQSQVETSKDFVDKHRALFESRILQEQLKIAIPRKSECLVT